MTRPTQAVIDLTALKHNYQLAVKLAPSANTMPIVKANAYGHGTILIAKALQTEAPAFGVASIEEALTLRQAGIDKPILLLEGTLSIDENKMAADNNFWIMITNREQLDAILNAKITTSVDVWLKVNTGMNRLGIKSNQVATYYRALTASDNVANIVLTTHFSNSFDSDKSLMFEQIKTFKTAIDGCAAPLSMANSGAILNCQAAHADWNRAGYMLYGNSPFDFQHQLADQLQPVMTLKSAIIGLHQVNSGDSVGYGATWIAQRPSLIATVAIGYADGYPYQAPSGTVVIIRGQQAQLVGSPSMDMISIDVTSITNVAIGDEVILWGQELSVNDIARCSNTIGYDLLTGVSERVPRIIKDEL